jgi:hypothetical protein
MAMSQAVVAQDAAGAAASDPPTAPAEGTEQIEEADDAGEIVVSGTRLRVSALKSDIAAISKPVGGQLARFQTPVCVHVFGLSEASAGVVTERIEAIALETGLRIGEATCKPNLTVVLSAEGRSFVGDLKADRPEVFGNMTALQFRQLVRDGGPAWAWQSTEPKRADGGPVEYISEIVVDPTKPPQRLSKGAYQVKNASLSRLAMPIRHDVTGTFVVIERAAVVGLTLQQIADFAGVAALGGADVAAAGQLSAPSILKLFACDRPAGCEEAATDFDLAFLKARYAGAPNLSENKDLMRIASSIVRELSADPPAGP